MFALIISLNSIWQTGGWEFQVRGWVWSFAAGDCPPQIPDEPDQDWLGPVQGPVHGTLQAAPGLWRRHSKPTGRRIKRHFVLNMESACLQCYILIGRKLNIDHFFSPRRSGWSSKCPICPAISAVATTTTTTTTLGWRPPPWAGPTIWLPRPGRAAPLRRPQQPWGPGPWMTHELRGNIAKKKY